MRFDEVADLYDRVRPGYPDAVFDDLAGLAGIGPGCRVLEIGCGTGQATVPLAERGCAVTAVELGARLAGHARRRLADYPLVRVIVADFERWQPPEPFDVVLAATAFHWLDPATRIGRTAAALRPGGVLATVATYHVAGGSNEFFRDAQIHYRRFDGTAPLDVRLPAADEIAHDTRDLDGAAGFAPAVFRRYEWEASYTATEYVDLLRTYSTTIALREHARRGLLRRIGSLIESRYDGMITKRYLTELRVARRLP